MQVGEVAQTFAATDHRGEPFDTAAFRDKRPVVIFFFPKAFTTGCTRQACAFRDSAAAFQALDAEVIGVSADPPEVLRDFAAKYNLPYRLVSDADGSLRKKFQVPRSMMGLLAGRVTYIIGRSGRLLDTYNSQLSWTQHVTVARAALEAESKAPAGAQATTSA
ncbi:hypothetical protein CDCA_CDCA01G0276 [Cyanidium caldarium]|uniref:thioredoxin-dependent peroxiredoxin n=1 Tax=Cyanidium caldarium TaxID=2771 RepID=A0AAV9IQ84_CYACA|nr:hypothetical protein CDCA_CDCA01G0276 [Cyanidium caldarium]